MDYSKLKKILIILTIISLLLSLKHKVLGYNSTELTPVTINGSVYNFDLNYLTSQYNYYFMTAVYGSSYGIITLFCFNNEPTVNLSGNNLTVSGNGSQFMYFRVYASSLSNARTYWNSHTFDPTLGTHSYSSSVPIMDQTKTSSTGITMSSSPFVLSNFNIKNSNGNIIYNQNVTKFPELATSLSDLESLNFDVVSVNGWDYSDEEFYILFYDKNSTNTQTTESLYPKRAIKLSHDTEYYQESLSANPSANSIYWIPIDEIGLNLYIGGTYQIRFAQKIPKPTPVFGATWSYHYIGETTTFTISSSVSQDKITSINNEIKDTTEQKYHDETINSINNVNNNLNNINNALTNTNPDPSLDSDIDDSLDFNNQNEGLNNLNNGFFSRLTTMLSNLLGYDLSQDTSVSIPLPNSNKNIVLHSNII